MKPLPFLDFIQFNYHQDFRFGFSKAVCDRRFAGKYSGHRPPASESPNHNRIVAKLVKVSPSGYDSGQSQ